MTLTIDLTPEEEARLAAVARKNGVRLEECAQQLLREHLSLLSGEAERNGAEEGSDPVARVESLIRQWQEQDQTPQAPLAPNDGTMTPTQALFKQWEEEDARMSPEEIEVQRQLWEDLENHFQRLTL